MTQMVQKQKFLKKMIMILSIVLIFSVAVLAGGYLYMIFAADSTTTNVTGVLQQQPILEQAAPNTTQETESDSYSVAPVLEFFMGKPNANEVFHVENMVPGDVVTRYFCLRTYHETPATIIFEADITEQTNQLGDYLDVRIIDAQTEEVIAEGTFNEINGLEHTKELTPVDGQSETYYYMEVSIDRWVGNECELSKLMADLRWSIEGGSSSLSPHPQTGEPLYIAIFAVAAACAIVIFVLLIVTRKKGDEDHEQEDEE